MESSSEVLQERLGKIAQLKRSSIPLYSDGFSPTHTAAGILASFQEGASVKIAGRMMTCRGHGKSAFADLRDETGKIQIYVKQDSVGENAYGLFMLLDLGDILGVEGTLFTTKKGEKTVQAKEFKLLSKIVRILPEKWHGLQDVEACYRQRYLDLIMNQDSKKIFEARSEIIHQIRFYLRERGFMEVETPMMQSIPGGARARPFVTHHEALDIDLYLRVAPELYLKRLLVGGFSKVYEINRNFRNEGLSTRHNPEFTMLELYQAYGNYEVMMALTEDLICALVKTICDGNVIKFGDYELNFSRPWKRISFFEALQEKSGMDWRNGNLKELAKKASISLEHYTEDVDILNEAFDRYVEPDLVNPTFVVDYPAISTPLAKTKSNDSSLVERFELFVGRMELANAFSELNDPFEQKERMTSQKEVIGIGKKIDEDFLTAMEYGMPPAGGLGIGIDRLVMLLTNSTSIRDVVLFPQMRPENKNEV